MKAVILAAGKSARLLPLNKNIHQCLLKVNNKTILERQIESLSSAGIEDISLVSGYHSEKVEEVCNKLGIKTFFNPFFELSGTAMTLWIAKSELKNGCYLISFIFYPAHVTTIGNHSDALVQASHSSY